VVGVVVVGVDDADVADDTVAVWVVDWFALVGEVAVVDLRTVVVDVDVEDVACDVVTD
jgi:hypothetical protein